MYWAPETSWLIHGGRPSLLDDLFTLIQNQMTARYGAGATISPAVPLRRALEVLNQILKEFTSIKMLAGIDTTTKVIPRLVPW